MGNNLEPVGTPLVLLINDEEWTTRSLESILKPEGYSVLMAFTAVQGLELASKVRPDLLLVDMSLPDMNGIELCSRLRELHTVRASTPLLMFASGSVSRSDEMDALLAGAWGVLSPPFDHRDLLARITPLIAAKRDTDNALASSFLDSITGLYNIRGLIRRISEISADTSRSRRPLACVVLGPIEPPATGEIPDPGSELDHSRAGGATRRLGELLAQSTRVSDVVGRVGEGDFVIIAPGTDEGGAVRLAERVIAAAETPAPAQGSGRLDLRAGFYAASGAEPEAVVPEEFLRRATAALREERSSVLRQSARRHPPRIRRFEGN